MKKIDYFSLLTNHIDIRHVPFSERGSRILIFRYLDQNALYIRLAERLTNLESNIEAYLNRLPFIQDLFFIDDQKKVIDFTITSTPNRLIFHTHLGNIELVFQDRHIIAFSLPANRVSGLRFKVFPQYWRSTPQGGKFLTVRNLVYNTTGNVIHNQISPMEGGYEVEFLVETQDNSTTILGIYPSEPDVPPILPFSQLRDTSEERWRSWFKRIPQVKEKYARTYAFAWWIMANNLISPQGKVIYEAMTPSKLGYVGLWLWDNAMHALAYRYVDAELARNQIRSMLAYQLPNGMVPDVVYDDGVVLSIDHPIAGEVTKPPILAWAALKLHEFDPDMEFLKEIYVPLVRLNAWWLTMNDDDGDGLAQYNHPYSSGLDDSPLWDQGMPVESPDLNTYLCIQCSSLAQIATLLNMEAEALMWKRKASAMVERMIKHFWDPDHGFFWVIKDHKPIKTKTPFNLYPLWTGLLPESIKNRLLGQLTNPDLFWGKYKLPTVAYSDPKYDPKTMWRGPVWANINYFFIEALENVGEIKLAKTLRDSTLDMIMAHEDIFEFYDAETGAPPERSVRNFGWTSAVFIDLAIQASAIRTTGKAEKHQ